MPISTTQSPLNPAHAAEIRPLGGLVCVLAGVVIGAGLGVVARQAIFDGVISDGLSSALVAGVVWTLGACFGFGLLLLASQGRVDRLGPAILAASVVRMIGALALGVTAYFILSPEPRGFWVAFLGAGTGALIAEVSWALSTIKRAERALTAATHTHTHAGAC